MQANHSKGGFKGPPKRSRNLARHIRKGANQKRRRQDDVSSEPSPVKRVSPQPPSDPQLAASRRSINSTAARRKKSKAELESSLRSAIRRGDVHEADAADSKLKLSAVRQKNNVLVQTTEAARSTARVANTRAKEAEADAARLERKVWMLGDELEAKGREVVEAVDRAVQFEVVRALGIAEERKDRHVAAVKKKSEKQLKTMQMEHSLKIKEKDDVIKKISSVVQRNRQVAADLRVSTTKLKLQTREKLDANNVAHREEIAAIKREHASAIAAKNNVIKDLTAQVVGMQDMFDGMINEIEEIQKGKKDYKKKLAALTSLAESRHTRLKESQSVISNLRDGMEADNDCYLQIISDAHSQIEDLQEQVDAYTDLLEEKQLACDIAAEHINNLKPLSIEKGKYQEWDYVTTQLIVEMLAHHTPPSCIVPNILSAAEILLPNPNHPVVKQLPSVSHVRSTRTVLLHISKTLAAYEIARAEWFEQLFTDGTSRRQTPIQNLVIKILNDGGYRTISLSTCIVAESESSESITAAIVQSFKESACLLDDWQATTTSLYPSRPDLLDQIPAGSKLTLSKLGRGSRGFTMTDTCSSARKLRRLISDAVKSIGDAEGLPADELLVREGDCWQHLRNVWFGAVSKQLNLTLTDILAADLESLPTIYRFTTEVEDLERCCEKFFGLTANYAKGQGSQFERWLQTNHPSAYLYPLARACGGSRQDLCVEGAPAVLMNIPYYLEYLNWRMSIADNGILATKLWVMLRTKEVIAMLRVLSILHISICLPTRWLAGKTQDLAEYNFGYYEMGEVLDLMEAAFETICEDESKILDEEFMLGIFKSIEDRVDPFRDYLHYMFNEKLSNQITRGTTIDQKELPYDLLRAALFYPSRIDIVKTDELCYKLAGEAAATFLIEFRDEHKATYNYLSSNGGKYSQAVITDEDRAAGMNKEASNSISESNHASSTQSLKTFGTIRLDSAAGEGQTRCNNDFGRDHNAFVQAKKNTDVSRSRQMGMFHRLPVELQHSLVVTAKRGAVRLRRQHDDSLAKQKAARLKHEELAHKHKLEMAKEQYIIALDYFERYKSERWWKSPAQSYRIFNQLSSESARLKAVKEQILIHVNGFGWDDVKHPWSKNGVRYTSVQLMHHFVSVVLSMEQERNIPNEPPMNLPEAPDKLKLGTRTELDFSGGNRGIANIEQLKDDALDERNRRIAEGDIDIDREKQSNIMPIVDESLVGYHIDYCFEYNDEDGDGTYLGWCDGVVVKVINAKTRMVEIKWNEKKVVEGDPEVTRQKLMIRSWNPKNPSSGAWRQFIGDPNA